jgi:hypothetical protein
MIPKRRKADEPAILCRIHVMLQAVTAAIDATVCVSLTA